ncbi:MAG: YCF48-related protein [Candidatus Thorarchaeota archaeon]
MINHFNIPKLRISSLCLVILIVSIFTIMPSYANSPEGVYLPMQTSETDWELLESNYPDAVFKDVSFLNSTHGWIAGRATSEYGSNAIVLYTENGGDLWQLQFNRDEQRVTNLDVLDEQTIWINGRGSLFHSFDGGTTWNESVVVGGSAAMSVVKFINMTHGWTSNNRVLYQSTDGGQTWNQVSGYTLNDTFRMIQYRAPHNIWAIGFTGIYHSIDDGTTWEQVSYGGGWSLSFVSDNEGWAIDDNRLAHTTNGLTWEELIVPMRAPAFRLQSPYCTDIQFIDEDNGWIVGTEIPVMYTPDGGANWYQQSVPDSVNDRIMAVDFINQTHGWAVGWDGVIMKTTTGNSLGNRLWYGMTDPLFLSIVAVVAIVVITSSVGIFRIRRRHRRDKSTDMEIKPHSRTEW